MPKHETRQVLTLYGERGWHDPDETDYTRVSINRGYHRMNNELNEFGKVVTIHSVSFSHVVFPGPSTNKLCRIYAEVVYSGTFDPLSFFGTFDSSTGAKYEKNSTMFHVHL